MSLAEGGGTQGTWRGLRLAGGGLRMGISPQPLMLVGLTASARSRLAGCCYYKILC